MEAVFWLAYVLGVLAILCSAISAIMTILSNRKETSKMPEITVDLLEEVEPMNSPE